MVMLFSVLNINDQTFVGKKTMKNKTTLKYLPVAASFNGSIKINTKIIYIIK